MPHTDPDLRDDPADAWLDGLIGDDAALLRDTYLDDAGFTSQVMAALPPPATLPRWRKPALTGLWATAGLGLAWALPGTALDVTREAFRLLGGRSFTLYEVAAVVAAIGIASWTGAAIALRRD